MDPTEASINPDEPYSWEFVGEVYEYRWQVAERRELCLEVESLYEAKATAISAELDIALAATDPKDHDGVVEEFFWEHRYVDYELPSIQRAATFIMLIHFFEARLTSICDGIGRELSTSVRLKDMPRSGAARAISFLKKHSQLDLAELAPDFSFLQGCKHLRNLLVHNGGHLVETNTRAVEFVSSEPTLGGQSTGEIFVTAALVTKLLDSIENLFIGIHAAMESSMRQAGNTGHVFLIGEMGRVPVFGPDPLGPDAR